MASKSDIEAGRAYVELYLKNSPLVKGLKSVQKEFDSWGKNLMKAGTWTVGLAAAIAGPLLAAAQTFNAVGSNLLDMSKRTGLAVEALSELGYAASQNGSRLEDVEKSARKMHQFMLLAERGTADAVKTLDELGLTLAGLKELSAEERFEKIGLAIAGVEDPGKRAALAMQVFGKAGTALLPLFATGAEGIAELRQEARDLGVSMSTEDAEAAHRLGDAIDRVKAQLLGMTLTIGAALAPALGRLLGMITENVKHVQAWIRENAGLAVTIGIAAAGIAAAGVTLLTLGLAFKVAAFSAGALATVLATVAGAIAALTSPVGLVVAGLASLAAYFVYASEAGGEAVDWLRRRFGELYDELATTFGLMGRLLSGGQLDAAARLLWALLKMEWAKGTAALKDIWVSFKFGMAEVFVEAWADIRTIWTEATVSLHTLWVEFTDGLVDAWEGAQSIIARGIAFILAKVEGLNPAEVMADVERQYGLKSEARDKEKAEALKAIEEQRSRKMTQIGEERAGSMAVIDEMRRAEENAIEDQVAAARAAWEKAMEEAEAAADKSQAEREAGGGGPEVEVPGLPAGQITTAGTFSAYAAAGLGIGAQERTARAAEKLAASVVEQIAIAKEQLAATKAAIPRFV